jgi:hypothetical protein
MEYITSAFRYVLGISKKEVSGYVLTEDREQHRTLLMVQEKENYWMTKWFNHEEYVIIPLQPSIQSIFKREDNR